MLFLTLIIRKKAIKTEHLTKLPIKECECYCSKPCHTLHQLIQLIAYQVSGIKGLYLSK